MIRMKWKLLLLNLQGDKYDDNDGDTINLDTIHDN